MRDRTLKAKAITTTTDILKSLIEVGAVATTTLISYKGIQTSRRIEGDDNTDVKHDIKDTFSLGSSTLSALMLSSASLEFLLFATRNWERLTYAQRGLIITTGLVGLGGAGYSIACFGVEHSTLAAGLSGVASILSLKAGKNIVSTIKNCENDVEQLDVQQKTTYNSI